MASMPMDFDDDRMTNADLSTNDMNSLDELPPKKFVPDLGRDSSMERALGHTAVRLRRLTGDRSQFCIVILFDCS
jgi:hypothetical protein